MKVLFLIFTTLIFIQACSSTKNFKEPATLSKLDTKISYDLNWKQLFKVKNENKNLILLNNKIYVFHNLNTIAILSIEDGKILNKISFPFEFTSGLSTNGDNIFVATKSGKILAISPELNIIWENNLASFIYSLPKVRNDNLYVRTNDGKIYSLDANSGEQLWMYEISLPSLILKIPPEISIDKDGSIYTGLPRGKIIKLSASSGELLWEGNLSNVKGSNELDTVDDIVGNPLIIDNLVCASSYNGKVGCLEQGNGNITWSKNGKGVKKITSDDKNLYFVNTNDEIFSFNKNSGTTIWKQGNFLNRNLSTPVVYQNFLIFGDLKGYIHFLSLEDGAEKFRIRFKKDAISLQPVIYKEKIFFVSTEGGIYSLSFNN